MLGAKSVEFNVLNVFCHVHGV